MDEAFFVPLPEGALDGLRRVPHATLRVSPFCYQDDNRLTTTTTTTAAAEGGCEVRGWVLDLPAERAALGPAFASTLSESSIASTREHMLGQDGLQAERYPLLSIHALEVQGEAPWFSARVAITLHGQMRELQVPLQVSGLPERVQASGSLVLRQSDFGIRPYSALGGLLAVQDDLVVTFSVVGEP